AGDGGADAGDPAARDADPGRAGHHAGSLARHGVQAMTRGFTLLEVMIAVAVLAMIGAVTWKSFDGAYGLKQRVEQAEDRDQTVRGALDRIAREVSMPCLSAPSPPKRFRHRPTCVNLTHALGHAAPTLT